MVRVALIREITPETLSLLHRIYNHSKHHQVRQRAHCIILRNQGFGITQLLKIFPVTSKTIYNWLNAWDSRGILGLYNRPGRGRKPLFTPEQKAQIKEWAQQYPKQLKQVLQKVKEHWDIDASTETIKRILKSMQMSWHRFRRVPWGEPDPQEYAEKKAELSELQALDAQGEIDLYYLDQAGFCLVPCIPYGWQMIGETLELPSRRSSRLNVLGIMNRDNDLKSYISEQSITSDVVVFCIDAFFSEIDKRTVIVMDRAPIHTSHVLQDKREEWQERQLEIFELPSYSPELNLIEILWRFMKYEWIEISVYQSWKHLVDYVEKVLREFGENYVINFA